ncbi:MAG: hypothetical protein EBU28_10960 [Gammaproteobacteria bacterium]|nr:hypothetical protein [Gammaproteobacteria bacterium]
MRGSASSKRTISPEKLMTTELVIIKRIATRRMSGFIGDPNVLLERDEVSSCPSFLALDILEFYSRCRN